MKKIFKYLIGFAAAAAVVSSCDDSFLKPSSPSAFENGDVYSNYDLAEGAILGIYQTFTLDLSYRNRVICWYGFNTDIEWYNTYDPTSDKGRITNYNTDPTSTELGKDGGPFSLMYRGVERCNLTIEGLEQFADLQGDPNMQYLWGEALTLRAMLYYDLTKIWGDVPARFTSVTSETLYQSKQCRDSIYVRILGDLDKAIQVLPYPGKTAASSRTDRVNKAFAEGLYARIALAASGSALRPDDGMVGTGDLGKVRTSTCPELQKSVLYPKALVYLKDVIENGGCSLDPSFAAYWSRQNTINNLNFDGETLFVLPFGESRGRWNTTFAVRGEASTIFGSSARGGAAGPTPFMWWKYDENDVRRDITCVNWKFANDKDSVDGYKIGGIASWYFGKFRLDQTPGYEGTTDDGIKPAVMRYADVLLMAAEIANELGDLSAAREYFLPVRLRAFTGHPDQAEDYVNGLNSKDKMFNAIVDERALEFCGEFLRKGDLIRWGMLKSKMDDAKAEMFKLRNLEAPYNYMTGDVYWKVEDGAVTIYGYKKGETAAPQGDWEDEKEYITKVSNSTGSPMGLYDDRINGLYVNNPEEYMFWPIFKSLVDGSKGQLKNDYHYAD
ncbi:MAG: RagB/SusD family nutrient uptake outer membrane protein [Bacteroidales bacterium]|nr:RagB/SusD family nutrient uptake outer membrane protein [Bacteroidales bacterium]